MIYHCRIKNNDLSLPNRNNDLPLQNKNNDLPFRNEKTIIHLSCCVSKLGLGDVSDVTK